MKKMRRNDGFTMVEILAVLLLIGILAAVATPKYLSLVKSARTKAVVSGIAEAKSSLATAYAKEYLDSGAAPSLAAVLTAAFGSGATLSAVTFGDIVVSVDTANDPTLTIHGVSVKSNSDIDAVNETWVLPSVM
ncbi:MAG: prepilin-type N-terminal cleavage/methylation domain-containing protein [Spartobacteria bacterium]|nr:prepilin-type N-terminal cleavage/methylation domain-containing protein [Spartobacteria bacterium]